jgi:cytosine/adenosine deaminase-related metal-dependent hydrolase
VSEARPTLKIDNIEFAITVDQGRRVVRDAAIVIDGQRIMRIDKADALRTIAAERTIDASGCVVTPAFVNGHMHISYAHAVRGNFPDDFVGVARLREVFRLQSAMTEQEEYDTTLLALIELLKTGTGCFVDPGSTRFLDACLQAYEDAGCRIITGTCLIDQPSDLALPRLPTDQALDRTRTFIQTYDHRLNDRVRAWAMPFSPDTCSLELLAGSRRIAEELGTGLTIHHRGGATRQLAEAGALGSNVCLAHAMGIDDQEVEIIADNGSSVVVCPSTTVKEGAGLGDRKLPELLARGVNVGLGSDSANSSNYLDPVRMLHAAAVGFKEGRRDPHLVPAEQAVEMGTLFGARAVGLGDDIGSIEPGKKADLVVFDTRRAEWRALLDPVNNLVYAADGHSARTVVIDGRVVVDDGQVAFADESAVTQRVQAHAEALLARTGARVNRGRWPII